MKIKILRGLQVVALILLAVTCTGFLLAPEGGLLWIVLGLIGGIYLQWSDQQPGFFLRDDYYII